MGNELEKLDQNLGGVADMRRQPDAVVIVVSQETGAITIAVNGEFITHLDRVQLREKLASLLQRDDLTSSRVADGAARVIGRNGRVLRRSPDGGVIETPAETLDAEAATRDSFVSAPFEDEPAESTRRAGGGRS